MREIGIMEVGGFSVGHAQNTEAATGCTVLLPDREAPCGADVRGGGPASRESQILQPLMDCQAVHAVLLSGGSAFGLDAAGGVQRYLEERGGRASRRELGEILHYHGDYLNRLVKRQCGKTILQLGQEIRVQQAAQLLRETELPVSAIVEQLGCTPTAYRQR